MKSLGTFGGLSSHEASQVAASFLDVNVVYMIQPNQKKFFEEALGLEFKNLSAIHQTWKDKGENFTFPNKSADKKINSIVS